MDELQINFLEQFMDDYQVNKFKFLVKNKSISSVMDLYDIRENYKNIELTSAENDNMVELMKSFDHINQKNLVKNIEKKLSEKKHLVEMLDTFVDENIKEF